MDPGAGSWSALTLPHLFQARSKVTRLGKQRGQLLESSLIFFCESVLLGTVDVDNSNDLTQMSSSPYITG